MTDEIQTSTGTKKKRGLFLPIALGIIAIAVVGFIASRAGLDKALVKQQVDEFAAMVKERGRAKGRDIDLSYGDLDVVGSFTNKHVVVHNPVLTIKPLERQPQPAGQQKAVDAVRVTTSEIAIYPESADLSSLRVELAQPIDIASEDEPEKSLLKVKSSEPLKVSIGKKKEGEVEYSVASYQSPAQMTLTYLKEQQATGAEEATPTVVPVYQSMQIDMAKGGNFQSAIATDQSGIGNAAVDFRDIVITPVEAPEGAVKLAEITGKWSNKLNEKKLNVLDATFKFGPVTSTSADAPYLPVTIDFDASYEGMMSKSPQTAEQAQQAPESSIVLKKLTITSKDSTLNATANFNATAGDVLPVGTANVALSNAPFVLGELRQYGMINPQNEPLVNSVLQLVTGKPMAELTDIVIPVERIRGGSFKVGNATFEELFAVVLKEAMQAKAGAAATMAPAEGTEPQAPLVPQLPAADKPKAAPIEVPDPSTRG